MTEVACRFGRHDHLVGVLSIPGSHDDAAPRPGVILLNAGLVHRIGPFRMTVELARMLAGKGYASIRFDLSTIGDSAGTADAGSREDHVLADVQDAMALLQQHAGCSRFVLMGLCSGAQNAHHVASIDQRVVGAVFMDGYAYPTRGFYLRHYLPRLLHPVRVARAAWRRLRRIGRHDDVDLAGFAVEWPSRQQVVSELTDMVRQGRKLCFIYSGGALGYFNHPRQFGECFGSLAADPNVQVRTFPEADHTFILAGDRARLRECIADWMQQSF